MCARTMQSCRGMTLIELTVVITILGALAGLGFHMFFGVSEVVFETEAGAADRQAVRIAIERFRRDVHAIQSASAEDITTMTATSFRFRRGDGDWVLYEKTGSVLERAGKTLLDDVEIASFKYFASGGATAGSAEQLERVALALRVGIGSADPVEVTAEAALRSNDYLEWSEKEAGS